jgi:hypothetical protein
VGGFRHLFWVENPYPSVNVLIVLLPEPAQYFYLSKFYEDFWRVRSLEVCPKPNAVGTYRLEVFFPRFLSLG